MSKTACFLVLLVLAAGCRRLEPGRLDFERMREQQQYRPYEAFWGTRNQPSMLVPPTGTVSRMEYTLGSAVATGKQDGAEV